MNITMQPCTQAGAAVAWNFTSKGNPYTGMGSFALRGTSLCLGLFGLNPDNGVAPNAALLACNDTDASQTWAQDLPAQPPTQIFNGLDGNVLDIYNNGVVAGTRVEVYNSNGGLNQAFTFNAASGQLVTALNGFCVAAC
jgi:hypothetical protein